MLFAVFLLHTLSHIFVSLGLNGSMKEKPEYSFNKLGGFVVAPPPPFEKETIKYYELEFKK